MKKLLLTCMFALTSAYMTAQTEVAPYIPGATVDGINYMLPRTALRVTVVAEKTVVTPGDLHKYAFKYLKLDNVPAEPLTTWTIKEVSIAPYGVPDKTKAYNIKLKAKTIAPLVSMTHDGIILSINAETQEQYLPELPKGTPANAVPNPRNYMNQEILAAGSTAKMAELCAQEIYDIRESRNALIRGEADNTPKDGAQLQLMLNQLDEQETALRSLFSGTTQTSTEVFTVCYDPTQHTERDILFRFSSRLGMVDKDDLAGAPIYISLKNLSNLPAKVIDPEADKKKAKIQEKGVYINVPAREAISIFDATHVYASLETPLAQFGHTEILSDILFNKGATTKVWFFQNTGAVQKMEQ